eukprot:TRINITY_DN4186_c0_g1_i2.p1 TRINITY_DN4186_c0_g1~~TRINITY_DN4186_c0_g1_i2.p1  ORF type:complete len:445 (-),score=126.61 TRINITY_DN4186_c0_g1_i2:43-1377(-)
MKCRVVCMCVCVGGNLAWFGHIWIGSLLYIPTSLIGILTIQYAWQTLEMRQGLDERQIFRNVHAGQLLLWGPLTVVGFAMGYGTSYLLASWVLAIFVSNFVSNWIPPRFIKSKFGMQALLYYVVSSTVAVFVVGQIVIVIVLLYVPMTGKMSFAYTHLLIAVIFSMCTNLVANPLVSASRWLLKPLQFKFIIVVLYCITIAGWISGSAMFPFTYDRPQRLTIQHKIWADAQNPSQSLNSYVSFLPFGRDLGLDYYLGSNSTGKWNKDEPNTKFQTQMTPNARGAYVFPSTASIPVNSIPTTSGLQLSLSSFNVTRGNSSSFLFKVDFIMPNHAAIVDFESFDEKIQVEDLIIEIDERYNLTFSSKKDNKFPESWFTFHQGDPFSNSRHSFAVYDLKKTAPLPLKLNAVSLFPHQSKQLKEIKGHLANWAAPMVAITGIQTIIIE